MIISLFLAIVRGNLFLQAQFSQNVRQILIITFAVIFREQPIFTCKAHVFHIDPKTKRSWLPASTASINVSFFYDSTRSLYRIISVEGTKVRIPSFRNFYSSAI